jgi:hypothetical protein
MQVTEIHQVPPLGTWHGDRVVLLGDSAHAMAPNLAQGACLAIQDALELASQLQHHLAAVGPVVHASRPASPLVGSEAHPGALGSAPPSRYAGLAARLPGCRPLGACCRLPLMLVVPQAPASHPWVRAPRRAGGL